jgi:hypothetical protein
MVLEKLESVITDERQFMSKEDELMQGIKLAKDKIIAFIQKDTNANVRDAAVSLLTTFKTLLPQNALVDESINCLPKYRV